MSQERLIVMECTVCKNLRRSRKNKKNTPARLEIKKYCSYCRKMTPHKETK